MELVQADVQPPFKPTVNSSFHIFCDVIMFSSQGFFKKNLSICLNCVPLRHHTLVLDSSGQIWAFGRGDKGQIGTGRQEDVLTPTRVELPQTADGAAAPRGSFSICVLAEESKNKLSFRFKLSSTGLCGHHSNTKPNKAEFEKGNDFCKVV